MQLINCRFGGLLETVNKKRHVASKHNVKFEKSRFDNVLSGISTVNSFHKFGITANTVLVTNIGHIRRPCY